MNQWLARVVSSVPGKPGRPSVFREPPITSGDVSRLVRRWPGALVVEGKSPRNPHQPGAEPVVVSQFGEIAVGFCERFLRNIFGIFAMPKHSISNPKRQPRTLRHPTLELLVQVPCHAETSFYEAA
jgi:hypothetical protein